MLRELNFYKRMPAPVRQLAKGLYAAVPLRLRLGKRFRQTSALLDESQWWDRERMGQHQDERLRRLIGHAYESIPYYRRVFDRCGLQPADIQTVADLPKLPILTKDDVRENQEDMRARNFPKSDLLTLYTSGTTGKPLYFYYERKKEHLYHDPYIWRFFGWGGHRQGQRRATLSSWTIEGDRLIEMNPIRQLLILSAYCMTHENVERYAEALAKYKIRFIDAYPTSLELMTRMLRQKKIAPPTQLQSIFLHSEYVYSWQREMIESYWGCKCFDWYAMEERVVLAFECERHEGLHLISDFGITELVEDPDTAPWKKIVATGLNNNAMPLIRYETGDVGREIERSCSCGRCFPLIELGGGRERNFALAKNGARISVTNIDIPNTSRNIVQFQFIQEKAGELLLYIVCDGAFGENDREMIDAKLHEKFSDRMDVDVSYVDELFTTKNRKTPVFIQRIAERHE